MYLRRKIAILWSFLLSALEGNIVFPTLFFLSGCALHAWLHTLFQQYFELEAERQHVFWEERFYSFDNIGIITHTYIKQSNKSANESLWLLYFCLDYG